jgi:conjugative relaxase-like TrwC/TraI family protein
MMRVQPLRHGSAKTMAAYYLRPEVDDVNLLLGPLARSQWWGQLAVAAERAGQPVRQTPLVQVLRGHWQGETVRYKRPQHRKGFELLFAAPKSVSLLALLGGDQRLLHAHALAVQRVLGVVESELAQIKITQSRGTLVTHALTHQLLFAVCHHGLSRLADPHLHTHVILANLTRDAHGHLRTLAATWSPRSCAPRGTGASLMRHQHYYACLYQLHLAHLCCTLGYSSQPVGNHLFELTAVPQVERWQFSRRSQALYRAMNAHGEWSAAVKHVLAHATRPEKSYFNLSGLQQEWHLRTGLDWGTVRTAAVARALPVQPYQAAACGLPQLAALYKDRRLWPKRGLELWAETLGEGHSPRDVAWYPPLGRMPVPELTELGGIETDFSRAWSLERSDRSWALSR